MFSRKDAETVIQLTAESFGLEPQQLIGKERTKNVALARQFAIAICRELLELSSVELGRIFNRDHTTILAAVKAVTRKTDDVWVLDAFSKIKGQCERRIMQGPVRHLSLCTNHTGCTDSSWSFAPAHSCTQERRVVE